ncbi:MAG: hypothetical protein PSV16_10460 [Flavobacterium sp.]|nr:hypothetical protein [Flavobacterium sp.]
MKNTEIDDLTEAVQQRNLVYNADFRYYSNKTASSAGINYGSPDGWVYADKGKNGKIGFNDATSSCLVVKSEGLDEMSLSQMLHEFPRWKTVLSGNTVSAKVALSTSEKVTVWIKLSDGVETKVTSKTISGSMEFDIQLKINDDATMLALSIISSSPGAVINIYGVYANVGNIVVKSLPCVVQGVIGERKQYIATENAPAEELSLCQAAAEIGADFMRLNSVLNNRFGSGPNGRSMLPDMRGYFSRSWNNGADTDKDAATRTPLGGTIGGDRVGTAEADMFLSHNHQMQFDTSGQILSGTSAPLSSINRVVTSRTQQEGGKETRPKNIAELYTIKWA